MPKQKMLWNDVELLLFEKPKHNQVWQTLPQSAQKEVIELVTLLLQEHTYPKTKNSGGPQNE